MCNDLESKHNAEQNGVFVTVIQFLFFEILLLIIAGCLCFPSSTLCLGKQYRSINRFLLATCFRSFLLPINCALFAEMALHVVLCYEHAIAFAQLLYSALVSQYHNDSLALSPIEAGTVRSIAPGCTYLVILRWTMYDSLKNCTLNDTSLRLSGHTLIRLLLEKTKEEKTSEGLGKVQLPVQHRILSTVLPYVYKVDTYCGILTVFPVVSSTVQCTLYSTSELTPQGGEFRPKPPKEYGSVSPVLNDNYRQTVSQKRGKEVACFFSTAISNITDRFYLYLTFSLIFLWDSARIRFTFHFES